MAFFKLIRGQSGVKCPLALLLMLTSALLAGQAQIDLDKVLFQAEDKEIVDQVLSLLASDTALSTPAALSKAGLLFLETPYVAHTLEGDDELLRINVREVDCTTLAEYCLALSRSAQRAPSSFELFAAELQGIRYREGRIDGYPSRLHYFCDWIYTNEQKGLLKDMSEDLAQTRLDKEIDFISKHPDSYQQLKENPSLVELFVRQEKEISNRDMYYVPASRVAELETQLKEGDIVGITTNIKGLAISHVGILVEKSGRIHLLHASSAAKKVVLSDIPLEGYLKNSPSATGIMVARPL